MKGLDKKQTNWDTPRAQFNYNVAGFGRAADEPLPCFDMRGIPRCCFHHFLLMASMPETDA